MDGDQVYLVLLRDLLEVDGYRVVVWPGGDGAAELLKREVPDRLILDPRLERLDPCLAVSRILRLDRATHWCGWTGGQ